MDDNKLNTEPENTEEYSLNDDRRVKVLSPGAMVAKRFVRNRTAVTGLVILIFMFLFSFVGGLITPYKEDQQFYRTEYQNKPYAGAVMNEELRFAAAEGQDFGSVIQAQVVLAVTTGKESVKYRGVTYHVTEEGPSLYTVSLDDGTVIGCAYRDVVTSSVAGQKLSFDLIYNALKAYTGGVNTFTADGKEYALSDGGLIELEGSEIAFISRYVINPIMANEFLSRDFQEQLSAALKTGLRSSPSWMKKAWKASIS
jgi:peptide/nickel transport system permease protein